MIKAKLSPLLPDDVVLIQASARAFAIGYAAQTSLRLAAVLPSVLTHPRKLLRAFVGRDSVRLGAFLASFVCTFKVCVCVVIVCVLVIHFTCVAAL